jgi:glutamate-1-semialdehyde 2,1-aminomutase
MGALRLARGATGRDIIIKCDGGYHGHSDGLLVSAGSGLATLGTSSSAGVPKAVAETTIVIPINNIDALQQALEKYKDRIAAFILEPVNGNVGVIAPKANYLKTCRELCDQHGTLLIFDEVMCGFRASLGGAQGLYGIQPDITVLGKVIGGGFPVGAYGASKELMGHIAPQGPVYQAGTLSGNPIAMVAGYETLKLLKEEGHDIAMSNMDLLEAGITPILKNLAYPTFFQRVGTMFSLFLSEGPIENYQDVCKGDPKKFSKFHRSMLESGVFMAPSPFEAGFMSSAHEAKHIEDTLAALEKSLHLIS